MALIASSGQWIERVRIILAAQGSKAPLPSRDCAMGGIDQVDHKALRHLIDDALELDIDLGMILAQLHIRATADELRRNAGIAVADYLRLQRVLNTAIRRALHERVGRKALTPDEDEVLFYYLLGSENLAAALARIKFFSRMVGERVGNGVIHLSTDLPQLAKLYVRVGLDPDLQQRFAAHFFWEQLKLIEALAWLIGQPIELARVEVPSVECAEVAQFSQRLRCPVSYGASGYGFYFARSLLQKKVVREVAELKSFLQFFGAVFVSEEYFDRPSLKLRVERILETQSLDNGGMPSAAELANVLNMSEATMRRRLRESGASFSEIKRGCRIRLGKKLLTLPNHDVSDIAEQLGFKDVNAFRRAFRQSAGETPEGFRKSAAAGDA